MKKMNIPIRTCIGCNTKKPKKEMIRMVIKSSGDCEIDLTGKKSGRGFYICYNIDCLHHAINGNKFSRYMDKENKEVVIDQLKEKIKSPKNKI